MSNVTKFSLVCLNCKHAKYTESGDLVLKCRRFPPVFVGDGDTRRWDFPEVQDDWWCTEFERGSISMKAIKDRPYEPLPRVNTVVQEVDNSDYSQTTNPSS